MRKITIKKENAKRKKVILGIILVFVMFASVFGIITNSFGKETNSRRVIYNGFEFAEQNGFWIVNVGGEEFMFRTNPKETEEMQFELEKVLEDYRDKPFYVDSKNYEANLEIYNNLERFVQRMQVACFEEPCEEGVPVKTCENNFIIIKERDLPLIKSDNGCVFISGPEIDLIGLTDKFLFKLLGIEQ